MLNLTIMKKLLQLLATFTAITAIIISCSKEEPTPEPIKYTLSVSAGTGGSVSTTGGSYEAGASVSVTATPNAEYEFTGWSNGSTDNPLSVTVNGNTTITANFAKVKYALNVTIEGEGTVTEEVVSTGKDYDSGTVVQYTAVPAEGWVFSNWSGAEDSIESSITLTADASKSITATFIEIPFDTASVGEGTIQTELVYNQSNEATALKLTAVTPAGWRFDGWTGGVESTEMEVEVALDLAEAVTATFIQVYDLTVTIEGEGEVTEEIVVEEAGKTYDTGTNVKLTAVPAEGWRFDKWTGAIESSEIEVTLTVDEAKEVTATFVKIYDLTVNTVGEGTITEEIVTTTGKTTSYDTGVTVQLTAEPAEGWRFEGWTGTVESTESVVQVEMSEAREVTATFIKIYDLNVTVVGEGEVIEEIVVEETGKTYDTGTTVKLTATPAEGWRFGGWSGAITSTDSTTTVLVDEAKEITATFIQVYDLNITIEGEGEVTEEEVASTSKAYDAGSNVKLTAVPAEGYVFSSWSGDITSTDNPVTVSVDGQKAITATFIENPVYLDDNGVTVKAYSTAKAGDKGYVDGVEYLVVDLTMLKSMIAANEDVTKVVTTLITDMSNLFRLNQRFNQEIGNWDTSNVTTMRSMFEGRSNLGYLYPFNRDISYWDTSKVTDMTLMFTWTSFNQDISNWDVGNVTSMRAMFDNTNFNQDIGSWDTSNVTDMAYMFRTTIEQFTHFNQDISNWDVSKVTDMQEMLHKRNPLGASFNQPIGKWNVSSVVNMQSMLYGNQDFNQDLSDWDISSVTNLNILFYSCIAFNSDISNWNTSNVETMHGLFSGATSFNQDISSWDTSKVYRMSQMFYNASSFNQSIGKWNTSKVTDMSQMFYGASSFNKSISSWDVNNISSKPQDFDTNASNWSNELLRPQWGINPIIYIDDNGVTMKATDSSNVGDTQVFNGTEYTVVDNTLLNLKRNQNSDMTKLITTKVTSMNQLFANMYNFNQDVSSWDTSNVIDMGYLFDNTLFNQDISHWNTSRVTNMEYMFRGTPFNQSIGNWDVSNVRNMKWMFSRSSFNQDISEWDVSSVTNMYYMFISNSEFNKPIGNWNVSNVTNMAGMFGSTTFNQDISEWDVSKVTHMYDMFIASKFNQDISSWDVSNVTLVNYMFKNASEFNQDLSNLWFNKAESCSQFAEGATSWILPKPNFPLCNPN
jgi:surface protein